MAFIVQTSVDTNLIERLLLVLFALLNSLMYHQEHVRVRQVIIFVLMNVSIKPLPLWIVIMPQVQSQKILDFQLTETEH
jgi:hypothetical protein